MTQASVLAPHSNGAGAALPDVPEPLNGKMTAASLARAPGPKGDAPANRDPNRYAIPAHRYPPPTTQNLKDCPGRGTRCATLPYPYRPRRSMGEGPPTASGGSFFDSRDSRRS